jgi:hypothetical protein
MSACKTRGRDRERHRVLLEGRPGWVSANPVRPKTLKALAKAALDVHPESLCPTAEAERGVMKLRIESVGRNALTLVVLR